jgi:hypothetical protein
MVNRHPNLAEPGGGKLANLPVLEATAETFRTPAMGRNPLRPQ